MSGVNYRNGRADCPSCVLVGQSVVLESTGHANYVSL